MSIAGEIRMNDPKKGEEEDVRVNNWKGCIPIRVSLAPTSLSCSTMPLPHHILVSRMTFLHLALRSVIRRYSNFAPKCSFLQQTTIVAKEEEEEHPNDSTTPKEDSHSQQQQHLQEEEEEDPICWLEDEESGTPLRWQLFVGVLYDLLSSRRNKQLPWNIRIHFTSYPSHLLQLSDNNNQTNVQRIIQRFYNNSLKQALYLQYGSNKIASKMSKSHQLQLWDSILHSNYNPQEQLHPDLRITHATTQLLQNVPVRIMIDGKPYVQKPCPPTILSKDTMTNIANNDDTTHNTHDDHDHDDHDNVAQKRTIRQFLSQFYPKLFSPSTNDSSSCYWIIQGIPQIPLSYPIVDAWQCLCHPDHFLYIIIITNPSSSLSM